jgi:hypothetical protein
MLFGCGEDGILARYTDVNRQALTSRRFPLSMGLRAQTLRLKFLTGDCAGDFYEPQMTAHSMRQLIERRFARSAPSRIHFQAAVGEAVSLLYAPFYLDGGLYDAVLNQPLPADPSAEEPVSLPSRGAPRDGLHIVAAVCPHCGWDLSGGRDAVVLACFNCATAWLPTGAGLKPTRVAAVFSAGDGERNRYLPFWRLKVACRGVALETVADFIALAGLFGPITRRPDPSAEFHFWVPAFKLQPETFLRLAMLATRSQPREKLAFSPPARRFLSPNLPVTEASQILRVCLAKCLKPAGTACRRLREVDLVAKRFLLVYLPFEENHLEMTNAKHHLTVNRNHLNLAQRAL